MREVDDTFAVLSGEGIQIENDAAQDSMRASPRWRLRGSDSSSPHILMMYTLGQLKNEFVALIDESMTFDPIARERSCERTHW